MSRRHCWIGPVLLGVAAVWALACDHGRLDPRIRNVEITGTTGTVTVSWQAPLETAPFETVTLAFSTDGGNTWQALNAYDPAAVTMTRINPRVGSVQPDLLEVRFTLPWDTLQQGISGPATVDVRITPPIGEPGTGTGLIDNAAIQPDLTVAGTGVVGSGNAYSLVIAKGSPLPTVTLTATDPNPAEALTLTVATAAWPAGIGATPAPSGNSSTTNGTTSVTLTLDPAGALAAGGPYVFTITVDDGHSATVTAELSVVVTNSTILTVTGPGVGGTSPNYTVTGTSGQVLPAGVFFYAYHTVPTQTLTVTLDLNTSSTQGYADLAATGLTFTGQPGTPTVAGNSISISGLASENPGIWLDGTLGTPSAAPAVIVLDITVDDGIAPLNETLTITVNQPPVMQTPPGPGTVAGTRPDFTTEVQVGDMLAVTFTATDPDTAQALTFTVTDTGGTITGAQAGFTQAFPYADPSPGVTPHPLALTGVAATPGDVRLTLEVTDPEGATDAIMLTIHINAAPLIATPTGPGVVSGTAPTFDAEAAVGQSLAATLSVTDANTADTLTFTVAHTAGDDPASLGFTSTFPATTNGTSPQSLALTGTGAQSGVTTLTVTADDGHGGTAQITIVVTVTSAPVLAVAGTNVVDKGGLHWELVVAPGQPLPGTVTITSDDADVPDTVALTVTFNPGASYGYGSVPAAITGNPAFSGDTATDTETTPTVPTVALVPSGNLATPGRLWFDLSATDTQPNTVTGSLLIRVNEAPVLAVPAALSTGPNAWETTIRRGQPLPGTLTFEATDPNDGDTVELTIAFNAGASPGYAAVPAALSFTPTMTGGTTDDTALAPATASVSVTPNGNLTTAGELVFDLTGDDDATTTVGTWTLIVNGPPQVSSVTVTPSTGIYGTTITSVTALVSDPEGLADIATVSADLSALGLGSAVTLYDDGAHSDGGAGDGTYGTQNPGTIPTGLATGALTVTVTAEDAQTNTGSDTAVFTLSNPAPTLAADPAGPFSVVLGDQVSFSVTATDPADLLTLTGTGVPAAATWADVSTPTASPVSSTFTWTPGAADVGQTVLTFNSTDSGNASATPLSVTIAIAAMPHPFDLGSLNGSSGVTLTGDAAGDETGFCVSGIGDVNADGFADFAVGAPEADNTAGADFAGAAYIVFGGTSIGSGGTLDLATELTGGNGFRLETTPSPNPLPNDDDHLGIAVSGAGDVNGDGIADLLVAAHTKDSTFWTDIGYVYLVYGDPSLGAGGTLNLSSSLQDGDGVIIRGEDSFDNTHTGWSFASAGDFNGDGYDDIVIGAPGANFNRGRAFLVFGSATLGVLSGGKRFFDLGSIDGTNGFRFDGEDNGDRVGEAVSGVGDFNADGCADVAIGAPTAERNATPTTPTDSGEIFLIWGTPGSLGTGGIVDIEALGSTEGVHIDGTAASEHAGSSLAGAGDVDGDGFADMLIGAPGYNGDAGAAYLIYGAGTLGTGGDFFLTAINGSNGVRFDGVLPSDQAGVRVTAASDLNGDGYDDILIGAEAGDGATVSDSGVAYLIFGEPSLGAGGVFALSSLDGQNGICFDGVAAGDRAGRGVGTAGDVNGDGFADIVIGAPGVSSDEGEAYLVYGVATDTDATVQRYQPSGDRLPLGINVLGDGSAFDSPSARAWLDWADGAAGTTTVTLRRRDTGLSNLPGGRTLADVADGVWELGTTRTGWSTLTLTLRYTDAEVSGLTEANLEVYRGTSLSGPWTLLTVGIRDTDRNRLTVATTADGVFIIVE